jgi:hypothetical protein
VIGGAVELILAAPRRRRRVPTAPSSDYVSPHGGLDLIGKAAVLKT